MRRICLAIALSGLVSALFASAATGSYVDSSGVTRNVTVNSQGLEIQAGYGTFADITITPIAAQSEAYLSGMPFNITEPFVQYNTVDAGRLIARWDVMANTPFELEVITCPHLTPVGQNSPELPFILTFEYNMSYSPDGVTTKAVAGQWEFLSGVSNTVKKVSSALEEDADAAYFIGSVAGNIYFRFQDQMPGSVQKVSDFINSDEAPSGNYSSTVTLIVRAEE